ncbi:MAG: arsinothricin resistance N-acetyltransferase ArsN1 family B [Pseudomonadota bacterium]
MVSSSEGDALNLRPAKRDDAESIAALYAAFVRDTIISFETEPPSVDEMARRIETISAAYPYLIAQAGRILGYAYASPHRQRAAYRSSVDVTVYVDPTAQRRGIGRTLYAELLAKLTAQGFHRAYAGIALPNDKSVGLHEAMGFRHVGTYREVGYKFGRFHDVAWYERDL